MRIRVSVEIGWCSQEIPGDSVSDRRYRPPFGELFEHFPKFSFEVEPVVENLIAVDEILHIALARLEEVGVDAGAHEGGDIYELAANVADQVSDLTGRGSHALSAIVGADIALRSGKCEFDWDGNSGDCRNRDEGSPTIRELTLTCQLRSGFQKDLRNTSETNNFTVPNLA